jgi:hypothetical protein
MSSSSQGTTPLPPQASDAHPFDDIPDDWESQAEDDETERAIWTAQMENQL